MSKNGEQLDLIGGVRADSAYPKFYNSKIIVGHGGIVGHGALGQLVSAILAVESAAVEYGNLDSEKNYGELKRARWALFLRLKEIERLAGQTATPCAKKS